jgi:hypothetical protein
MPASIGVEIRRFVVVQINLDKKGQVRQAKLGRTNSGRNYIFTHAFQDGNNKDN